MGKLVIRAPIIRQIIISALIIAVVTALSFIIKTNFFKVPDESGVEQTAVEFFTAETGKGEIASTLVQKNYYEDLWEVVISVDESEDVSEIWLVKIGTINGKPISVERVNRYGDRS